MKTITLCLTYTWTCPDCDTKYAEVDVGYDVGVDAAVLEMAMSLSPESGTA